MGAELEDAEPFAQGGVNPPLVPAGSGLAKAGPFEGEGCAWSQPSGGCVIKLAAEGFYNIFQCVIKKERKGQERNLSFRPLPAFGDARRRAG